MCPRHAALIPTACESIPCCRGAAERVCRRWRRVALALPASRVTLDFADSLWGEDDPDFVPALLQELGSRPVGCVNISNPPDWLPRDFWQALGEGLVARALRCAQGSVLFPLVAHHLPQHRMLLALPGGEV